MTHTTHSHQKKAQKRLYTLQDNDFILSEAPERKYVLRVRDLPEGSQPRQKLLESGVESLSIQELLAVVLNSGNKKEGVLELSSRIIREYGNSALAGQVDATAMAKELQISLIKACQVVSCLEIGRRLYKKHEGGLAVIRTAKDVYDYLKDMHTLPKEQLRGLYLDTHNRVIHQEVISIGTINSNIIHPREVFRPALEYGAAAVVLAHNHPSGVSSPSLADIEITRQIIEAGRILGVHLMDHVVISEHDFTSVPADY